MLSEWLWTCHKTDYVVVVVVMVVMVMHEELKLSKYSYM
jgi:hypothetical protein